MKCPKCGYENGERTVCGKCGTFVYSQTRNRRPMTPAQRRKELGKAWKQALKGTVYSLLILLGFAVVLFFVALVLGLILPDSMFDGIIATTVAT
jgi:uncharacterized membrane protein YbhN (UPF0104 family)